MHRSQLPTSFNIPWANSGTRNVIPQASQIGVTPGAASLTDGFPPLTLQNLSTGGVPPDGADTNGILYELTGAVQWGVNAGATYPWSSAFSAAIGGYPAGAYVTRADNSGAWISTVDDNTTNPDAGGAGWLPAEGLSTLGGTCLGVITFHTAASDTTATTGIMANVNGASRIDPNGSSFLIPVTPADVTGARALFSMKRTDNGNQIWSVNADGSQNVLNLTASGGVTAGTGNFIARVGGTPTQSSVTMGGGVFNLSQSANAADHRCFQLRYDSNLLGFYLTNDAQTTAAPFMTVAGGSAAPVVTFPAPTNGVTQAVGNNSTLLATTAWVHGEFPGNSTSGWQQFPDGAIVQRGNVNGTTTANQAVNFPIPFPNFVTAVVCTCGNAAGPQPVFVSSGVISRTQFFATTWNLAGAFSSQSFSWVAWGG